MYLKFYIAVEKCTLNRTVIFLFLLLSGVEVQQTTKFSCTSANCLSRDVTPLEVHGTSAFVEDMQDDGNRALVEIESVTCSSPLKASKVRFSSTI
jgi:hypothetical protein